MSTSLTRRRGSKMVFGLMNARLLVLYLFNNQARLLQQDCVAGTVFR